MQTAPPPPRPPVTRRPPARSSVPWSSATGTGRPASTSPAATELALVGVTVAGVIGLGRLFTDASFLAPVLVVVLAGHGLAWGARRLGVGPLGAVVLSGVGLLVAVGWVIEPGTTTWGLPLGETWAAIGADLRAAWVAFGEVRAPTPVTRGFVLAAAIGGWVVAFAADTFAFRARTRLEAVVPSFVLILFGALIGADRHRLATTVLYLAAVLVFVVLSEASGRSGSSWFAGRSAEGDRALVRAGLATALVGVAAAVVVGPGLPGARSPGLVSWRVGDNGDRPSARVTVSPLVDIRSRLVNQSNTELFTVRTGRSSDASYWRLTSLERYDGRIWSSSGSFEPARRRLPTGVATRAQERVISQEYSIGNLSAIWLPAAFRPERLDGPKGVRYDPDSSSLLTDQETSNGLRYRVDSALPQLRAEELAPASAALPPDDAERYLSLPGDFPARVRREAQRRTAADAANCGRLGCSPAERASGQLGPFHAARALQDWFRTSFTYDLNVDAGHKTSDIEDFLFGARRGYCEQFAGSFAAMARSIGLPSRVAVGFVPGAQTGDGTFHVTGKEAHAWPEVFLAGFGWVAFEPTPSRAIPGAESYTGVTGPTVAAGAVDSPAAATTTPTTVAPGPAPEASPQEQEEPVEPVSGLDGDGSGSLVPGFWPVLLAVVAGVYLGGVPLVRRLVRRRRRAAATTPTDRVLVAWQEAEEDLALAGLGRRPAETGPEYARRLGAVEGPGGTGAAQAGMAELARHRSAAAFSPTGVGEPTAQRAEAAATAVTTALRSAASPTRRILWALHPGPVKEAGRKALDDLRKQIQDRRTTRPA